MSADIEWLAGLSPWPADGFGLDRINELLALLGDPQLDYPAVHVVGTNGKSTATVTIEQYLLGEGLAVGSTVSPHVRSWDERIRLGGRPADLAAAVHRIRPAATAVGATQFESITAAALTAFSDARVDVAVVEAGLGGRYDATNVLRSTVVLLTNVDLEHTDVLGDTVEEIATEKLAVVHTDDTIVVLPDDTFRGLVPRGRLSLGGAREAAEAFVGHAIEGDVDVALPGRLERRESEIRDGAHNPAGIAWLLERLPAADYTVCASILADKDAADMLAQLASGREPLRRHAVLERAVADRRSSRLARAGSLRHGRGRRRSGHGCAACPRARRPRPRDRVALPAHRSRGRLAVRPRSRRWERVTVLLFALVLVAGLVGAAFAAGYILGKFLL